MTSDNQFTKKSFNKSSNSFSGKSFGVSANSFTLKEPSISGNVYNGENLSGGVLGNWDEFGGGNSVFGVGEFGGIDHFRVKTRGTVTH